MGFLNPLYVAVAWVMARIHSGLSLFLNPDGGLAWALTIVLLVAAMRLILVPLFIKQMHSMRKMSALNPQLQELRKKFKNDKQTLNEETMRLYREAGVNPLGGCLPLVAQLPMFFALFNVLRGIANWKSGPSPYGLPVAVVRSAQNANILGAKISDKVLFTHGLNVSVEAKIVICCAVAISVVTTFLTVRQSTKRGMTPAMTPDNPMAASQKYMAYIVPFFALSGLYWAFGLVLYWVTTNVWTLGQQYLLFKRYPPEAAAAAAAGGTGGATPPARPATAPRLTAGGRPATGRPASDALKRPPARPATAKPADGKPADGKPAGAKPGTTTGAGTARPAAGKPAATGQAPPRPGSARPGTARPGTGRTGAAGAPAAKPAAAKPAAAASPPPGKKPQGRPNGQAASGNGSGSSSGLLRRFGRGKAEPEEQPAVPEAKLVRQQRVRQSRSKRSGKR